MEKPKLARQANERIAKTAKRHRFVSRIPLVCECSDPDCTDVVLLSLERFEAIRGEPGLYLTVPGHQLERSERASDESDYWLVRRLSA